MLVFLTTAAGTSLVTADFRRLRLLRRMEQPLKIGNIFRFSRFYPNNTLPAFLGALLDHITSACLRFDTHDHRALFSTPALPWNCCCLRSPCVGTGRSSRDACSLPLCGGNAGTRRFSQTPCELRVAEAQILSGPAHRSDPLQLHVPASRAPPEGIRSGTGSSPGR